ncbi:MAG: protein kinase [Phycisphaerae bacterium]|nr:protein kinase [Gemmatimonadaceae bacterium]
MRNPPARLREALSRNYRIERELGAGGMATVYLAHDLKHQRDVAIKVLKSGLAQSLSGERFLREIAITARLNHPHILPLLESGETVGGDFLYYVMPLASGESLREHMDRDGALPVSECVRLGMETVEALVYAHTHGVVHRDIKPANVLLSDGHAVVADFGIAKALGDARDTTRERTAITTEGTSLGTPLYMAPEQATGEGDVDHRADIYAVGVMLFEMVAGAPPFTGTWHQVMVQKMSNDVPSLSAHFASAPPALVRLIAACMASDASLRPQTAGAVLQQLRGIAESLNAPRPDGTLARKRTTLVASALGLAALIVATIVVMRDRDARWLRDTALPEIERLVETDQLDSAFALITEATGRAPDDSTVTAWWPAVSQIQTFLSEPSGAEVSRASIDDTTKWIPIGTTPASNVRIPKNAWFYRYSRPGYLPVTVMGARLGGSYVPIPSPIALRKISDADSNMVLLRGAGLRGTLFGLSSATAFNLSDFLFDKTEITNRQYRAFVAEGGYTKPAYWDSGFVKDGQSLTWESAMALMVDRTGRPGPSTWEGGAPPADADDLPVGGVSWYEARAYARFVGKDLPTVYEWNAAAIPEAARWVVPHGRYEATSPVRGGNAQSVGPRGVYDLAGNVREWTANPREPGSRYILGGGYSDPAYLFAEIYAQPEFDRAAINGIRLVRRMADSGDLAAASAPIPRVARDARSLRPVDDVTFRALVSLYDYDHTPLNAEVESRDTTHHDWIREDITFELPKPQTRMTAVLFTPKRVNAPYQTVVLWPASDAFILPDVQHLSMSFVDYLSRSGRAVLYPMYEHTYAKGSKPNGDAPAATIEHRDQVIRWATQMRRSIDYAMTRPEIDSTKLAYVGTSWGGRMAGVVLALEPRFRAAVLNNPGIGAARVRPEEDAVNFLPRIRIPVLLLSGRYDSVFPYESSQKPFLELLGSPAGTKRQSLFEGGHFLPRTELVSESLAWLDQYLGRVNGR